MPRIYDSASSPLDFCKDCYPTEEHAEREYGDVELTGEGPDGRGNCYGYDAEHPDYDYEDYTCIKCGQKLDWQDN
jgi:hypothetical protein